MKFGILILYDMKDYEENIQIIFIFICIIEIFYSLENNVPLLL